MHIGRQLLVLIKLAPHIGFRVSLRKNSTVEARALGVAGFETVEALQVSTTSHKEHRKLKTLNPKPPQTCLERRSVRHEPDSPTAP